jgi:hypothetical protein
MTEKLNAGAELEKELAEKLGWRIINRGTNGELWENYNAFSGTWKPVGQPDLQHRILWAALLEYAAEAALYRTQEAELKHISCAWCEATFDKKTTFHETMEMMADHMLVCEKHPYPEAHSRAESAELRATEAEAERDMYRTQWKDTETLLRAVERRVAELEGDSRE